MSTSAEENPALDAIARCREEIERIDTELVRLLQQRVDLGRRTGELKRAAGLPIVDPEREAAVIAQVTELARRTGLPVDAVRELFRHVVAMSRRAQGSD